MQNSVHLSSAMLFVRQDVKNEGEEWEGNKN